jgi:hypothetical protein
MYTLLEDGVAATRRGIPRMFGRLRRRATPQAPPKRTPVTVRPAASDTAPSMPLTVAKEGGKV